MKLRGWNVLALACAGVLTACGGGGGSGASSVLPAASAPATPMPMSIISWVGNTMEITGTIAGMIPNGFTIQGGKGVGFLHIYLTPTTVINGPSPFVGENVDVQGTGSPSTSLTATQVSQLTGSPAPAASASPLASAPPTATPVPVVSATPTPAASQTPGPPSQSAITPPGGVVTAGGVIVAATSSQLTIQAGTGCGYMHIYVNASTMYSGGTPQTGEYGYFTGPGSRCISLTATTAWLGNSAFSSTSQIGGSVAAATPYGFTLATGNGTVPVALSSSSVVFGGALVPGANVTVTAYGNANGYTATQVAVAAPTPAPVASPTPTPGPITTSHVMLAGYIYGYAGVPASVPVSSVSSYITWAFTDNLHVSLLRQSGVKVVAYTNFWRNYTTDSPQTGYLDLEPGGAHAGAEAKDCNGNVLVDPSYGGGYESDARTTDALAHAQIVAQGQMSSLNNDAIFSDDTGTVWGMTLPCNYDEAVYDQAVNTVHTALNYPMFVNALSAPDPSQAVDLLQPGDVLGAECELCYAGNGNGSDQPQVGTTWQETENAEIAIVGMHKIFWDYARISGNAAAETALRTYAYASFLLTYDPSYAMFQEALATPSGFPVMPETQFVPLNPLTTSSSIAGYAAPGGAYFREFADCYYAENFVSRCAVAVNPGSTTVPVPSTSYSHSVALSGSGVLDGGAVSFNGPAVTQLAPGTAVILLP